MLIENNVNYLIIIFHNSFEIKINNRQYLFALEFTLIQMSTAIVENSTKKSNVCVK